MRILAVDDERLALTGLLKSIKEAAPEAEAAGFREAEPAIAYMEESPCDVALLDIRLRGRRSGIELAKELKMMHPAVNIIFTTGYDEYLQAAFDIHANGYLKKPITPEKIKKELSELRRPLAVRTDKRLRVQCFGNFEVFAGEKPVTFRNEKTKEFFAYLVDRNGARVSGDQICAILWENSTNAASSKSYLRTLASDLKKTLLGLGIKEGEVYVKGRDAYSVNPQGIWCDYYEFLAGNPDAINAYRKEYMAQYSWAEFRTGWLDGRA